MRYMPRLKERPLGLILACAGLVLALDTVALARRLSLFRLPGEVDEFEMARRSGHAVASELERSAHALGVGTDLRVRSALSTLQAELGLAASPADVVRALYVEATAVERAIAAARTGSEALPVDDADEAGLRERIRALQDEIGALQRELAITREQAGTAELSGPGIVVCAYDAHDGYRSREIVHERDVREILNLLFYAGARGAEVGGQRIVACSSIRCAGPVLLVNQQLVPVNPVMIRAVGDPAALGSSLADLSARFVRDGKKLEVTPCEIVTLAAFSKGRT